MTLEEMKDFLGEDGEASDALIAQLMDNARAEIATAAHMSMEAVAGTPLAQRALRVMVWLEFFAVRDAAKNTQYLTAERTRLLTMLRYRGGEADAQA